MNILCFGMSTNSKHRHETTSVAFPVEAIRQSVLPWNEANLGIWILRKRLDIIVIYGLFQKLLECYSEDLNYS
jgi:hypothetical protein